MSHRGHLLCSDLCADESGRANGRGPGTFTRPARVQPDRNLRRLRGDRLSRLLPPGDCRVDDTGVGLEEWGRRGGGEGEERGGS